MMRCQSLPAESIQHAIHIMQSQSALLSVICALSITCMQVEDLTKKVAEMHFAKEDVEAIK
jgi:hypothetical protein